LNTPTLEKRKCNFCGEEISIYVRRCPYCGSLIEQTAGSIIFAPQKILSDVEPTNQPGVENTISTKGEHTVLQQNNRENSEPEVARPEILRSHQTHRMNAANFNLSTMSLNNPQGKPQVKKPLSNGYKVFLTVITSLLPGLGQLLGLILSIVYLNAEDDDRRSFGTALMIASLITFVLSSLYTSFLIIALMR
jgi:hypothetical protein